jgi:hypothetical protein
MEKNPYATGSKSPAERVFIFISIIGCMWMKCSFKIVEQYYICIYKESTMKKIVTSHFHSLDYLRFYVPLQNFSLIWRCHPEGLQNLGLCSALRAFEKGGIDIYCATPAVTWGSVFSCLIRRTALFSRLSYLVTSYDFLV